MRAWELQQAVHDRLKAWPAIVALGAAVHDHVPQNDNADDAEAFPYFVIGEDSAEPFNTDDELDSDHVVTLHQWSRYRGTKEIKQMQQGSYAALHRNPLTVVDATYVDCHLETEDNFMDDDGLTRHGVQRFRFLLDEVTP